MANHPATIYNDKGTNFDDVRRINSVGSAGMNKANINKIQMIPEIPAKSEIGHKGLSGQKMNEQMILDQMLS